MQLVYLGIVLLVLGYGQQASAEKISTVPKTYGEEMIKVQGECANELSMEDYLLLIIGVDLEDVKMDTVLKIQDCIRKKRYPFFVALVDWDPDDFDVGDECFLEQAQKSRYQKIGAAELDYCFDKVKEARTQPAIDEKRK